jgi:hypothetical protein
MVCYHHRRGLPRHCVLPVPETKGECLVRSVGNKGLKMFMPPSHGFGVIAAHTTTKRKAPYKSTFYKGLFFCGTVSRPPGVGATRPATQGQLRRPPAIPKALFGQGTSKDGC